MYEAHEETRRFMDVRNYLRGVVRRRNKQTQGQEKEPLHFALPKVESRVVAGFLPRNNLRRAYASATIGQDTSRRAPRPTSTYCDTSAQRHRGTAGWGLAENLLERYPRRYCGSPSSHRGWRRPLR